MVKKISKNRVHFLKVLIQYNTKTSKIYFSHKEMMEKLGVNKKEFDVIQKRLGNKYCSLTSKFTETNEPFYEIHIDDCLELLNQIEKHQEIIRVTLLCAVLAAVLTTALTLFFL